MKQIPSSFPCSCSHSKEVHITSDVNLHTAPYNSLCKECHKNYIISKDKCIPNQYHKFEGDNLKYLESKLD